MYTLHASENALYTREDAHRSAPRPGSLEETEALADIDQARYEDERRHREPRSAARRRLQRSWGFNRQTNLEGF